MLLTVPLPENTEFVSAWRAASQAAQAAPLNVSVVDGQIIIKVGDVAAGENVKIELVLRALVAGQIVLGAGATTHPRWTASRHHVALSDSGSAPRDLDGPVSEGPIISGTASAFSVRREIVVRWARREKVSTTRDLTGMA